MKKNKNDGDAGDGDEKKTHGLHGKENLNPKSVF